MMDSREFVGSDNSRWEAFAADMIVAHGKPGAILAFRQADDVSNTFTSTVTFNSLPAAEFALRTMSEKELNRRLSLARKAAGSL